MSKRHPGLKASSVLILCGAIVLVCLSLYHSVPMMRSYGRTTATAANIVVDIHQNNNSNNNSNNKNESLMNKVQESTETQVRLPLLSILQSIKNTTNDNGNNNHSHDASVSEAAALGEVTNSSYISLPSGNDKNNSQITHSFPSTTAATTLSTSHSSNLPSANESTTTTLLSLQRQNYKNETEDNVVIDPALIESRMDSSFFVNYIMNSRPPIHANCHRKCVDFRNRIYVTTIANHYGAGLIDRLTIFATMLNIAGYLCARLYVPRPKFMLRAEHNYNNQKLAATNITWSEFGTFVLLNDPEQQNAVIEWDNPEDVEVWPVVESLYDVPADAFHIAKLFKHVIASFPVLEQFVFQQQQRLASISNTNNNNNQTSNNNNQTSNNNNYQTNRFVWRMQADYYIFDRPLVRLLQNRSLPEHYQQNERERLKEPFIFANRKSYLGCQYAKTAPAPHLLELQEKVVEQIREPLNTTTSFLQQPPIIGYFHVRRQDTISGCNTNTTKIKNYLTCSLGEAILQLSKLLSSSSSTTTPLRSIRVLFSSDEVDPEYRQEVMKLIEEQQFLHLRDNTTDKQLVHVTAIDFDHLVKETIRNEAESGRIPSWRQNNFYAFQLILNIGFNQSVVHFHMEQRRENCDPCINVTDQLRKAGLLDVHYATA